MTEKSINSQNNIFRLFFSTIFIINAGIFFFQALTKNLFPPLLLPLRDTFFIDNTQAGLLVTLVFFGYALARFPSGIIADQIGCTKTVLIGSAAMALSFILVSIAPNYSVMAVMTFILGISSGIYVTAGYTLAVIIGSRKHAATATAAFETFGLVAGIISPLLVTLFVIHFSWQLLFIVTGLFLIVLTLFFYKKRSFSASYETVYDRQNGLESIKKARNTSKLEPTGGAIKKLAANFSYATEIFQNPGIRRFLIWSTLVGGLGALSWTGINAFIPTFLVENKGYSYDLANKLYVSVAIAGFAVKIIIGWLADRFGTNAILFINLAISITGFFLLVQAREQLHVIFTLMLLGAMCLNTNTLINSYVLRHMPPSCQGTGFGLFSTAYTAIYSLGPYLTGFLSDLYGLGKAIQLSSVGAILAALLILTARYFLPRDY